MAAYKIVIDAMGGDFAPEQQVLGAVEALNKHKDLSLILVGDEEKIREVAASINMDLDGYEIINEPDMIEASLKAVINSSK